MQFPKFNIFEINSKLKKNKIKKNILTLFLFYFYSKMRKISIIIILLSFNLYFFAQSLVDSIKIEDNIIKIRSDKIQNIYIQKENQLIKLDTKTGKQIKSYSNLQLGAISLVDVQNPMKILLYYKEFNSFLFLNSQLSLITNEIDLTSLDIYSCSAIAYSKTNSFFIFD